MPDLREEQNASRRHALALEENAREQALRVQEQALSDLNLIAPRVAELINEGVLELRAQQSSQLASKQEDYLRLMR